MKQIASMDIGLKRIGLALCLDEKTVLPQEAIFRKNRDQAAKDVSIFLEEWRIDTLVAGLPKGGSSEEEMSRRIKHFISLLDFGGQVAYLDEYGTSYEAKDMIKGEIKQKRDGRLDSLAAKIILERWLESKKSN